MADLMASRAGDVAGLLLAAGAGRRLGCPKALVKLGGAPLTERGLGTLRTGGCRPVMVVLGAAAEEVRQACSLGDAVVVVNDAWSDGMGGSVRAGRGWPRPGAPGRRRSLCFRSTSLSSPRRWWLVLSRAGVKVQWPPSPLTGAR